MAKRPFSKGSRDAGGFIALPWLVIDSPAYRSLSPHARALLVDVVRQYGGANNGALLCSRAHLSPLGWTSNDMLTKAKRELLDAGLLFETVKGCRPNKASWYAVTWLKLDKLTGFDAGTAAAFDRGAYLKTARALDRPTGQKPSPLHRPTVQGASPLSRHTVQ